MFGYRPFGINPSRPAPISAEVATLFRLYATHLCGGVPASGPPDVLAALHKHGRWIPPSRLYPVNAIAWRPLRPGKEALDINLQRIAFAS